MQTVTFYQGSCRNGKIFHHAAIHMYAANFHLHAAIRFAPQAGIAKTAMVVRYERNHLSRCKSIHILHQLTCQFMPQYPRITEVRLIPLESMKICAANARPPDADD